jgi:predicted O-linked N-acetylglucosamine transferase (SPINDLY family)
VSEDRLQFCRPSSHEELLGHYAQIDIALDPFPYNGGATTCEALGMGVPVVTLRGDRFVSRVGSTILHNAGLGDLVTAGPQEYVQKAVDLAQDPALLARVRSGMRDRLATSALCDTVGFTKRLESAYRDIWRRWCRAQARG